MLQFFSHKMKSISHHNAIKLGIISVLFAQFFKLLRRIRRHSLICIQKKYPIRCYDTIT